MLLIISAYLIVVRYGPRMMASRQPFQLKPLLVIYNFSVAALNLYIAGEILYCITKRRYSWLCQLVDYSENPYEIQFCVGLGFGINAIFSGCKFTRWMQYAFIAYAFSFLVLFGNFYVHAYRSRYQAKASKTKEYGELSQEANDNIDKQYLLPTLSTMCFPEGVMDSDSKKRD